MDPNVTERVYSDGIVRSTKWLVHPRVYQNLKNKKGAVPLTDDIALNSPTVSIWVRKNGRYEQIANIYCHERRFDMWKINQPLYATPKRLKESDVVRSGSGQYDYSNVANNGQLILFDAEAAHLNAMDVKDECAISGVYDAEANQRLQEKSKSKSQSKSNTNSPLPLRSFGWMESSINSLSSSISNLIIRFGSKVPAMTNIPISFTASPSPKSTAHSDSPANTSALTADNLRLHNQLQSKELQRDIILTKNDILRYRGDFQHLSLQQMEHGETTDQNHINNAMVVRLHIICRD